METAREVSTMRNIYPQRRVAATSVLLGLLAIGSVFIGGCVGDRPPMAPERTWEEVRYHRSESLAGGGFRDMSVNAAGEMILDLQGQRAPTRGLLAGENLEMLTRLIDALPSAGTKGTGGDGAFFVSVRIGGERIDYATGPNDEAAPPSLLAIGQQFDRWVEETRENRRAVIPFRVLADGTLSAMTTESCQIVHGRDDLLRLLSRIGAKAPAVLPAVDFSRESVVGIFMGARPTGGYGISVDVTYRTLTGQVVIKESRVEPAPGCEVPMAPSAPYVLIAIATPTTGDFLIESSTVQTTCGPVAGVSQGL
jgi:hypothetical protein